MDRINLIGWIATTITIIQCTSQIHQIIRNVRGMKGSWLVPIMGVANCLTWLYYFIVADIITTQLYIVQLYASILAFCNFMTVIIKFEN